MIEARRTIAVNALKRVVKMNPTEMRPILMSIIVNPVESAEVRIAAVSILPFSQPTTAELQKLAIRSWMEPSEQVSSFIVSTLRSLSLSQVPELKTVGLKAKLLTLDEWKDRPGLKTNSRQLWDLGKSEGPEGGDNEGRDLLRWLHPGTDGQLLKLSGGWL